MPSLRRPFARRALVAALTLVPPAARAQQAAGPFRELTFRSIGPAVMGGRIHDVQALRDDPSTVYIAAATGGIWKTTNHGTTWTPIFDHEATSAFGVIAIAPSDPKVLWAGTGEQNNRQSSSWGDGVYRSTDAGASWTHVGLDDTRAIGRIVVDPHDPDVAYVAALGNLWAPSSDRGVYRTTDGGRTWTKSLFVDTLTGAVDLAMDPNDPHTLYAATYQRLRTPCCFNGGGPGSGIYRTTDGGATWQKLGGGLPTGDVGRIGLGISRQNGKRVYAVVEAPSAGGVYRTDDGGAAWTRVNALDPRPMYYSSLMVDPTDDARLYMMARWFYRSDDAGAHWRTMPTEPTYDVGLKGDYHAMWIDPGNPDHFYLAGDGGLYQSWDLGATYTRINNIPIGQFYGIGLDDETPFNIYGGMQDDHSWFGPSATRHYLGITGDDWREIGFNDGVSGTVDRQGRHWVYSNAVDGDLTRVDAYTGDRADIHPAAPAGQPPYRFEWITPGMASRHTPGLYYYGGNRLFITRDQGRTWRATPDLTRRVNRDTMVVMGVPDSKIVNSRNDGQSAFSALSAIEESRASADVLWVGTDDGDVQLSRDGGQVWSEVGHNAHGVPDGTYVSRIATVEGQPGSAYVAFDDHRRGNFRPYLFRTTDFGKTWTSISAGLPDDAPVRTVAVYPGHANVVFAGTEHALFVSTDAGAHWVEPASGLPTTLYVDVQFDRRTGDVVVATHGRSLWILDDGTPLAEWSARASAEPAHLFAIRPATIFQYWEDLSYRGQDFYAGENPPDGAIVDYSLGRAADSVTLTVTNAQGEVVRTLRGPGGARVVHRVVWDLRHAPPPSNPDTANSDLEALPRPPRTLEPRGPFVSPGRYTVTLSANGVTARQTVDVRGDPEMPLTQAQYRDREAFLLDLLGVQGRAWALTHKLAGRARGIAMRLERRAYALAGSFNGTGALSGTLYPPTAIQRRELAALKTELAKAEGAN
ncbi:MAG: hypothetical protein KGN74_07520 [Gemmatimonadota bacterium]|nr:hypothetical protein [Gemmatimonadota bacterium]